MRSKNDKSDTYYQKLWDAIEILSENQAEVETEAENILKNVIRYKTAESLSGGVPWKVIAVIHLRESNLSLLQIFLMVNHYIK